MCKYLLDIPSSILSLIVFNKAITRKETLRNDKRKSRERMLVCIENEAIDNDYISNDDIYDNVSITSPFNKPWSRIFISEDQIRGTEPFQDEEAS